MKLIALVGAGDHRPILVNPELICSAHEAQDVTTGEYYTVINTTDGCAWRVRESLELVHGMIVGTDTYGEVKWRREVKENGSQCEVQG